MTHSWRLVRLFMALFFVTNVACTPVVYVQPTGTMSFQQLLASDAVIGARVAAHNMRGRVGVEPPELFANAGFEFVAELFQSREVFFERLDAPICKGRFFDLTYRVGDKGFEHGKARVDLFFEQATIGVKPRHPAPKITIGETNGYHFVPSILTNLKRLLGSSCRTEDTFRNAPSCFQHMKRVAIKVRHKLVFNPFVFAYDFIKRKRFFLEDHRSNGLGQRAAK